MKNAEANRFDAAWRFAPFDRRGFTVCVRASGLANAPGFQLWSAMDADVGEFEYVWFGEIEEVSGVFTGRARESTGRLAAALSKRRVSFALSNIVHWAFAPNATCRLDSIRSALQDDFAPPSRELVYP